MTPALDAVDIRKSFTAARRGPVVDVLHGVSLAVAAGEMVSVVGPSGSGKSTLLYCLAGLERPTAGSVTIAGTDTRELSGRRLAALRRSSLSFVFQSYNLVPSLTAAENVALPARLARRAVSTDQVAAALDAVGVLAVAGERPPFLSGGQQQRVAIARALLAEPAILFADEPTGALDAASGRVVLDLLRGVRDRGSAVLMVTHDLESAARADRSVVIRDGRVHRELIGPTAEQLFDAVVSAD
ncbi:ATP-binding cassette domain-containing protein [Rathayibacter sp. VKM Ac-2759]|uniref:ABC transporter ATP-binding protein n=1 Tax=Rathayibacter sp. VKM Ac-2759 TaxID=2609252 RepID=UPI0013184558|nr:ABC transporter ATP-binding protein [Rathayibacter sp. VKM Ac-2759]QHC68297.1 ATP-binding cassette domain-containing protein [Rathayibacter sp. VKM Ac-2759]